MPAGDRTGPSGYGPMTGRGAGFCTGHGAPGYVNAGFGRGRGFGGGGRGWRHMYCATGMPGWARGFNSNPTWTGYAGPAPYGDFTPESEMEMLKNQSDFFRKQIDVLNERISELEGIASRNRGDKE